MEEALALVEDKQAEFHGIDEPVIKFKGGVNEIQHIQQSFFEITEEQSKDKVWSKVIGWLKKGQLPEKAVFCDRSVGQVTKNYQRYLSFIHNTVIL